MLVSTQLLTLAEPVVSGLKALHSFMAREVLLLLLLLLLYRGVVVVL